MVVVVGWSAIVVVGPNLGLNGLAMRDLIGNVGIGNFGIGYW